MKTTESIEDTLRIVRNVQQWQEDKVKREAARRWKARRAELRAEAALAADIRHGRIVSLAAAWPTLGGAA